MKPKVGIVLFQLAGPHPPEPTEPFLTNIFFDPEIINFPMAWIARKALAKLISTTRSKKVGEHYKDIGGFSPIRRLTEDQAAALAVALKPHVDAHVVIAMRYWRPTTQDAVASLAGQNLDQIILLPLYPQYSFATTRSSFNEWNRRFVSSGVPLKTINHYYDHP